MAQTTTVISIFQHRMNEARKPTTTINRLAMVLKLLCTDA